MGCPTQNSLTEGKGGSGHLHWAPRSLQGHGVGPRANWVRANKVPALGWPQAWMCSGQQAGPWPAPLPRLALCLPGLSFPVSIALSYVETGPACSLPPQQLGKGPHPGVTWQGMCHVGEGGRTDDGMRMAGWGGCAGWPGRLGAPHCGSPTGVHSGSVSPQLGSPVPKWKRGPSSCDPVPALGAPCPPRPNFPHRISQRWQDSRCWGLGQG